MPIKNKTSKGFNYLFINKKISYLFLGLLLIGVLVKRTKNYLFILFNDFGSMISGIPAISFLCAVFHALFKSSGGI